MAFLLGVVLCSAPAAAQSSQTNDAKARRQLNEALAAFQKGNYDSALQLFRKSLDLQATSAAWLGIGRCERRKGHLVAALAAFTKAESIAITKQDRMEAQEEIAYVSQAASTLTVRVYEADPNVVVMLDGRVVANDALDQRMPVDGGNHTIRAELPTRIPFRRTLAIAPEDDHQVVDVPPLEPIESDAHTVYARGVTLLNEGRPEEACTQLLAAWQYEATSSTALRIGECTEAQGRFSSALEWYQLAERTAPQHDPDHVEAEALLRLDQVRLKVAYVIADMPPLEGPVLLINGRQVPRAEWSRKIPVDPGPVLINVLVPGANPWGTSLEVQAGVVLRVEVPGPQPISVGAADASPPPLIPSGHAEAADVTYDRTKLALGLTSIGLGGASLGLGVAQYFKARGHESDDRQQALALQSAMFGVAGASLVTTGAILTWSARHEAGSDVPKLSVQPLLLHGGAGLRVENSW